VPVVEPLVCQASLVDDSATQRSRREDEFGVWEGRAEGLGAGDRDTEKLRAEFEGRGATAVEEDDGLDVGLKGWYDERLWVCGVWAVGGN